MNAVGIQTSDRGCGPVLGRTLVSAGCLFATSEMADASNRMKFDSDALKEQPCLAIL